AARDNGFGRKCRWQIVLTAVGRYRMSMRILAGMNNLDIWYSEVDVGRFRQAFADQLKARQRRAMDTAMTKARAPDSKQGLGKLCRGKDGERRIGAGPPLGGPVSDLLPPHMDPALVETGPHRAFR